MTDREYLEMAAKAAGIDVVAPDEYEISAGGKGGLLISGYGACDHWNPIADDGDAFRLMVKLKIDVAHTNIHSPQVHALADAKVQEWEDSSSDPLAATRRAIVRAAAEIGRSKT